MGAESRFQGADSEINGGWATFSKSEDEKTDGVAPCTAVELKEVFCGLRKPMQVCGQRGRVGKKAVVSQGLGRGRLALKQDGGGGIPAR